MTTIYYEGGALHKITTKSSKKSGGRKSSIQAAREEKHCQFCFLNGQPIKVTRSHNDMDINCASMSDVDRRRRQIGGWQGSMDIMTDRIGVRDSGVMLVLILMYFPAT